MTRKKAAMLTATAVFLAWALNRSSETDIHEIDLTLTDDQKNYWFGRNGFLFAPGDMQMTTSSDKAKPESPMPLRSWLEETIVGLKEIADTAEKEQVILHARAQQHAYQAVLERIDRGDSIWPSQISVQNDEVVYLVRCGHCGFLGAPDLGHCARCGYDGGPNPQSEGGEWIPVSALQYERKQWEDEVRELLVGDSSVLAWQRGSLLVTRESFGGVFDALASRRKVGG